MKERDKREILIDFLDNKILDPVLEAMPEQYSSERDRKMLLDVKQNTASIKAYLHSRKLSPEEIRAYFFENLSKETISAVGKELEDLELPRLKQLRNQFTDLCQDLQLEL